MDTLIMQAQRTMRHSHGAAEEQVRDSKVLGLRQMKRQGVELYSC